jgi:hypothetical protein
MRAYMLHGNGALPQAAYPLKIRSFQSPVKIFQKVILKTFGYVR